MKRTALVQGGTAEQVANYLPTNYKVTKQLLGHAVIIEGEDNAGWTLKDYVIPRLASGLITCTEQQQREHSVPCRYCRTQTFSVTGICERCERKDVP